MRFFAGFCVDIVLIVTVRVALYVCLGRSGRAVPVLGPFYDPKFGAKKVSPHSGGATFWPQIGGQIWYPNWGQIWYPKQGRHMVPKNKVSLFF